MGMSLMEASIMAANLRSRRESASENSRRSPVVREALPLKRRFSAEAAEFAALGSTCFRQSCLEFKRHWKNKRRHLKVRRAVTLPVKFRSM
jgi:hypothetical protein